MKQFITHSPSETEQVASQFAQQLKPGDVIAYRGGLGVGKTAFTRGLAEGLQVIGEVSSPTFSLVNEYQGKIPLYHFDMYRINTLDDLYFTGFFDYLENGSILAIEWSENIADYLPENTITVELKRLDETTREITIDGDERF
ncbi:MULTISPECIES: tRNA (adenosine(37)-N6)-threonylcarbamoyltransferase complex ATPase subunit type 1 TsaE [Clostridiaceae]|uniref:tRNA threonylcarbamoyladenosine biosynthesis protein TsaE n=1 Tax=Clostridium facile TaxID=2763035 RepID=A0ABR7ITK6_9CLOT|nr:MULTISPECIES: tRNA (adenosine(37)-N6)-threonylcarbamoyltransferase complex ATPase subunit type 1 TsaE [Clostridiaceae]MBC5788467.1 tRNA (adenosine(37)-N6)-threonylcarbamoyltransferase complex ATPase subunit type 1 TsaE [Clostridium facile]PWM98289.1 MAG: tRNA (adenosine(37)-N6)-threonylcarbamoyltransferase complex ATPase subunit type 1 TsaE [Massilioclostridium sp.]